jgi:hypothetical protein
MKMQLDMDRIARGLGAERRGKIAARGGYFGAMQLLADIEARFRVPSGRGRPTDPGWTERRLLPLAPRTLKKLEEISAQVREHGMSVEPMQLAAAYREDDRTTERGRGRKSRSSEAARQPLTNLVHASTVPCAGARAARRSASMRRVAGAGAHTADVATGPGVH